MTRFLFAMLLVALPARALTFAEWIASHGLTGGNAALTADPDHDRMDNLTEYVLAGGDPDTAGPWNIMPVFGWSVRMPDGGFGNQSLVPPNGAPIGSHVCLTYTLRTGIEDVAVEPQASMPCPASNNDGSLFRWVGGQSVIRVMTKGSGLQAVCLLRSDLMPRAFMKLSITHGAGLQLPPVQGAASATLALDIGAVSPQYRTVGSPTVTNTTDRDVSYTQTSNPSVVTDMKWPWALGSSGLSSGDVTRSSSNLSVLSPTVGNTQLWTYQGDGSALLRIITPAQTYERLVNAIASPGAVVSRVVTGSTSGSLRAHMVAQTDTRAASFSSIAERARLWTTWNAGVSYARNTSCWASGVDLTPIAVWNSETAAYGNSWRGQTLISPRHYIGAAHWAVSVGTTLHFVTSDNTLVTRTVTATQTIAGTDILVGVLNSDVPGTISFARVLPDAWATKLPTVAASTPVPVARLNRGQQIHITDLISLSGSGNLGVQAAAPTIASRLPFYVNAETGDSGSPMFAIIGDKMVLLCALWGGGGGSGPFITARRTAINAAMAALGGGYSLTDVSLGSYTSF